MAVLQQRTAEYFDGRHTSILEEKYGIHSKLFKNRDVFNPTFVPSKILQREAEIEDIVTRLKPLSVNSEGRDFIIHGLRGVGKTVIVKHIMDLLSQYFHNHNLNYLHMLYINCRSKSTEQEILVEIANSFIEDRIKLSLKEFTRKSIAPKTGWDTGTYYDFLKKVLNLVGGQFLIIFDEVEKLDEKGRNVLYYLSRETQGGLDNAKCTLILITNDLRFFTGLDSQTQSSLGWNKMHMNPYKTDQLYVILKQRADMAFVEGAVGDPILWKIAARVASESGDARKAISILENAAEFADDKNVEIDEELIDKANRQIEYDEISETILKSPIHKRIFLKALLVCIKTRRLEPITRDIYRIYNEMCEHLVRKPVSDRWIRTTIKEFCDSNIIEAKMVFLGKGQGSQRVITLVIKPNTLKTVLESDEDLVDLKDFKPSLSRRF